MKLVLDEKLKHRLIGFAVIISLGAIFAPAMMKKSSQNMENNYTVHVTLPAKPAEPNVAMSDEKEVFKTIKIAKVKLPTVSSESQLPQLAKAEPLQREETVAVAPEQNQGDMNVKAEQVALRKAVQSTVKREVQLASAKSKAPVAPKAVALVSKATKPAPKAAPVVALKAKPKTQVQQRTIKVAQANIRKPATKTELYAVQLASFSQLSNAQSLVNKLRTKGYKANFTRVASRNGVVYKVYAGHSPRKMEVVKLKSQLASAMQLNGFIVNTGVS